MFAVPGAASNALRAQVDRALRWEPHVAVIVVGANDLTRRTSPELAARGLGQAVRRLRAGGVEVVVAPAPDLSMVPQVPPELRDAVRAASMLLRNHQIAHTVAAGGRVADAEGATSDAFGSDPSLFSFDRFHPSSAGYAVIAAALLPVVLDATQVTRAERAPTAEQPSTPGVDTLEAPAH